MADGKLNDMMNSSLEKIYELAGAETIIGNPITTPSGVTVIPVSKVSIGFASGGADRNTKDESKKPADMKKQNFYGGGGTGVSITPVAFLTIGTDGNVSVLPITASSDIGTVDKVASLIERSPDILQKLKDVFTKGKKEEKTEAEEPIEEDVVRF